MKIKGIRCPKLLIFNVILAFNSHKYLHKDSLQEPSTPLSLILSLLIPVQIKNNSIKLKMDSSKSWEPFADCKV